MSYKKRTIEQAEFRNQQLEGVLKEAIAIIGQAQESPARNKSANIRMLCCRLNRTFEKAGFTRDIPEVEDEK